MPTDKEMALMVHEITSGVTAEQSRVPMTPENRTFREKLEVQIREMVAKGISPDIPHDLPD